MRMTFVVEGITRQSPKVDPDSGDITPGDIHTVTLVAAYENSEHWEGLPSGKITMMYLKPESSEVFTVGEEFDIEINRRA